MRKQFAVLAICTGSLMAATTAMADDIDALMDRLSDLDTLSTDFRQLTLDAAETSIQTLTGTLQLERPNNLYWYSNAPYEQAIYVSDGMIWIYDIDLEQAVRQPLDEQWEQSPALVLTGTREQISARYAVTQTADRPPFATFTLEPLGVRSAIDSLALAFDGKKPTSIRLVDSFNQTTLVNFDNVVMNTPIDASVFTFNPPAGVDVIEQLGP
ncbi:outer membrane lipoprotein chaperone LolA [Salinispirillum sp. LH 10-3-1]|uniref:Outer-membrane lipoprotein carrier protein n=1 Tax=Salinispirillum sp. LH 10-3-1 TaxID=2952525 RepID=A0AB38YK30_9GAMM